MNDKDHTSHECNEWKNLLRKDLKTLRVTLANDVRLSPSVIFTDCTIDSIIETMPRTEEELMGCYDMGYWKVKLYAQSVLFVVNQYQQK